MRRERRIVVALVGVLFTVVGLACESVRAVDGSNEPAGEACFDVRRVSSFSPLHEMYVYIRVDPDKHYLLTMDRYCTDLPYATGIAIATDFGRVCSSTRARITYREYGSTASCGILRVEAVASKEEAQKLVEERLHPRPKG